MRRALSLLVTLATAAAPTLSFADFQINTYTTSDQIGIQGTVACAEDGSFVVVWSSVQDGSGTSIEARRFDAGGAPIGTEFQVNTYTTSNQFFPAVSSAPDGKSVIVWSDNDRDGPFDVGVFGQRFDAGGAPAGTEFQAHTYTTGGQSLPRVSSAADGSFVVVWVSSSQDGDYSGVEGQRFDASGAPTGTEFQVNSYTTGLQYEPVVSIAADASFVVAWSSRDEPYGATSTDVRGQRFDSSGAPAGTEFMVSSTAQYHYQSGPAISSMSDGGFVVVWTDVGGDVDVRGRRFDAGGAPAGTEFGVSYTTGFQQDPAVASAADGSFVVAWESFGPDGSGNGIRAQRFDASGALSGSEIQMNTYTTGEQNLPSICSTSDGRFMVVWRSTDGDGAGVFGRGIGLGTTTTLPGGCTSAPVGDCLGGAKASLRVKKSDDPAENQIRWKLQKGDAFDQNVLGDPSTSRAYALCIYDETAGVPSFVTSLTIAPSPNWDDKNPKGFRYKDTTGTEDGVIRASLKTGASEKTGVSVSAKGAGIPMPAPFSGSELFDLDTKVTVQLINDETSTCWTSEFTAAGMKKNDPTQFNAKTP